jgi:hypothetical protein
MDASRRATPPLADAPVKLAKSHQPASPPAPTPCRRSNQANTLLTQADAHRELSGSPRTTTPDHGATFVALTSGASTGHM